MESSDRIEDITMIEVSSKDLMDYLDLGWLIVGEVDRKKNTVFVSKGPQCVQHYEKILIGFDILWKGWDMDARAWVVECTDGSKKLVITDHGTLIEEDPEFLSDKLEEYEAVIGSTKQALELIR